jgi:hypothetical protein
MKQKLPKLKRMPPEELEALLQRTEEIIPPEDALAFRQLTETLNFILENALKKDVRIKTLLKQIMGIKSEKTKKIKETLNAQMDAKNQAELPDKKETELDTSMDSTKSQDSKTKPVSQKPKGHGRNGVDTYTGADRINAFSFKYYC